MIVPTVLRGFSDEYGSWKIICISRRSGLSCAPRSVRDVLALELDRARSSGRAGAASSRAVVLLPQPVSPTMPERLAAAHVERHAVDRVHGADLRWKTMPCVIGKCLTRSRTSTRLLAPVRRRLRRRRSAPPRRARPRARLARAARRRAARCHSAAASLGLEQAGDPWSGSPAHRLELRVDLAVRLAHVGAARVEVAADGGVIRLGGRPGIGTSSSSRGPVEARDRLQQAPGVGVLGRGEDRRRSAPARRSARRTSPRSRRPSRPRRRGRG